MAAVEGGSFDGPLFRALRHVTFCAELPAHCRGLPVGRDVFLVCAGLCRLRSSNAAGKADDGLGVAACHGVTQAVFITALTVFHAGDVVSFSTACMASRTSTAPLPPVTKPARFERHALLCKIPNLNRLPTINSELTPPKRAALSAYWVSIRLWMCCRTQGLWALTPYASQSNSSYSRPAGLINRLIRMGC